MRPSNVSRRARSIGLALAVVAAASPAAAEPTDQEQELATTLFRDGKSLLSEGRTPEACRKFEESRRLNPLPGTILNLAVCHEKEGRLASALSEFHEARVLAERDGRGDRTALADEHIRVIEPRVARLVVVVAPGVDLPELRIVRDATPLGRAAWGSPVLVDPGEHVVEASAPGKRTWRSVLTVRDAELQTAVVAMLEDEPRSESAPAPVAVPSDSAHGPAAGDQAATASTGLSTRRTLALATAGLGVLGLGVGGVFGVMAIQKHNHPDATCTTSPCPGEVIALNEQAKTDADVSTVGFAVGLVALAGAALLWFGDRPSRPITRVRFVPVVRSDQARFELGAHF